MTVTQPAWGLGLATLTADGTVLDVWFPEGRLGLGESPFELPIGTPLPAAETAQRLDLAPAAIGDRSLPGIVAAGGLVTAGSLPPPPKDPFDIWLRLHLLSHRLIKPHDANLDGVFGLLTNVAWTSAGPCPPHRVDELRRVERAAGRVLSVFSVDKFPRMTDYVVPSGVRIADADRARLGAHPAHDTNHLHEGRAAFNARPLGTSMVE